MSGKSIEPADDPRWKQVVTAMDDDINVCCPIKPSSAVVIVSIMYSVVEFTLVMIGSRIEGKRGTLTALALWFARGDFRRLNELADISGGFCQ